MSQLDDETFESLDERKGIAHLPSQAGDEYPLPEWHRKVYRTPLKDLELEDLCRAIRQRIHHEELVPIALLRLAREPLAGDVIEGELLVALRAVDEEYWSRHREEAEKCRGIVDVASPDTPEELQEEVAALRERVGGARW